MSIEVHGIDRRPQAKEGRCSMTWHPFDDGRSRGQKGSEGGAIILDDEHPGGARITLEEGSRSAPYTITCAVYGSMLHTRFFKSPEEARSELAQMKGSLEQILRQIPAEDEFDPEISAARVETLLEAFLNRFP